MKKRTKVERTKKWKMGVYFCRINKASIDVTSMRKNWCKSFEKVEPMLFRSKVDEKVSLLLILWSWLCLERVSIGEKTELKILMQ